MLKKENDVLVQNGFSHADVRRFLLWDIAKHYDCTAREAEHLFYNALSYVLVRSAIFAEIDFLLGRDNYDGGKDRTEDL